MSKKDYIAIARLIRHLGFTPSDRINLIQGLQTIFANDNPRFDPEKFFEACWSPLELQILKEHMKESA